MRLVRIVLLLLVLCAVGAAEASACSCAGRPDGPRLADAGAAFVGTLVERRELPRLAPLQSSADPFVNVYRVEQVHKGALGETVEVHTVRSSATCGLDEPVGTRVALYLRATPAGWAAGSCNLTTPEGMAAAANGPVVDPGPRSTAPCPGVKQARKARTRAKQRAKARLRAARRSQRPL